jgi:integrase
MARPRVRKDPKRGTWIVEHYDQERKQHRYKGFKTKKEADARADAISGEVRKGTHVPDAKSDTVADASRVWLERSDDLKLETATRRQYKNHVHLHLLPLEDTGERPAWQGAFGKVKLARLNTPVCEAVLRELQRRLSFAMTRKVLSSLKAILDEALRQMMIGYNPALSVKFRRRDRDMTKIWAGINFPTKEELGAVIRVIEGRWRPVIVVLGFCGVRASELRGLEWLDVLGLDTAYPELRIRQRADEKAVIGDTKTVAGQRTIPLVKLATDTLREWREVCPRDAATGELRFVFPNGVGKIENHSNISNRGWKEWQIQAGVCVPRRNEKGDAILDGEGRVVMKAKYGVDQGFQPKRVQTLLGHSSIQMTLNVYAHLFPSDQADDAARFAKAVESVIMAAK